MMRRALLTCALLLGAGSAHAQSSGTVHLLGPSNTPGASRITTADQINDAVNAALASKFDYGPIAGVDVSSAFVTPTGGTQKTMAAALAAAGSPPAGSTGSVQTNNGAGGFAGVGASSLGVTPTGAASSATLAALASQQGVLLDTFRVGGDADDTASMTRAVAAGGCVLLGPKTYTINNYSMAGTPTNFCLKGVQGQSIIQRTAGSGSQFFQITAANVVISGVTFDMNKASVTANQWGVFLGAGGQTISIANSTFKNNSGSLGSCLDLLSTGPAAGGSFTLDNVEITGCTFNPLYLASVSRGVIVKSQIHDNSTNGVVLQANGTASTTNYSTNIRFSNNNFYKNTGTGLSIGSFAPPYIYGTPAATFISVVGNDFQDNGSYQLGFVNAQQILVDSNQFVQTTSSVSTAGGIDCNSQYLLIQNNNVSMPSAGYGIDCGAATEPNIRNNTVTMGARGTGIDVGGVQNGVVAGNHVDVAGTAVGVVVYDIETDGNVVPFPYHASNVTIQNNDIQLSGTGTVGVQTYDDAGATSGALPVNVLGNRFVGVSGAVSAQDVNYFSAGSGIIVSGNTHNGASGVAVVLNGSTDYIFDTVYDQLSGDTTAGSVRAFVNGYVNTYNSGTKILFVLPTAGGTAYTAATTLSGNGGCTWAGTPLISAGVIIGVRTTSPGASCSSGTTISATDSGGGSGATFAVTVAPTLPSGKTLLYTPSASNVIQTSGGAIGISGISAPIPVLSGYHLQLRANNGGSGWRMLTTAALVPFAIGSLPTCNSSYNGSVVAVTGSVSGAWQARCNGTNWIAPSGSIIS